MVGELGGQERPRQAVRGVKGAHREECRGSEEGNVLQGTVIEEKETKESAVSSTRR